VNYKIEKCSVYTDERGNLVQFLTRSYLEEANTPFGQIYFLNFNGRDVKRGNHYHNNSSEIFCLVFGEINIVLEDVVTKERIEHKLKNTNNEFFRIFVGPKIAHTIISCSEDALVISYSSVEYDKNNEDKIVYNIL
jgi:dTDP-4-dehydrorhamnose 3,5-epimerase-like enzyme